MNPAAIPLRWEIIRRISIPQSAMGNGIRSATVAIPHGSAADATPETSDPRASPLITVEGPTVSGILLARPGALHRFAAALVSEIRVSAIRLSLDRVPAARHSDRFRMRASDRTATHFEAPDSIPLTATADLATEGLAADWAGAETAFAVTADTVTVGGEVFGPATVGVAAFTGRAFLAMAGEVGALAWDGRTGPTDGTPGGTTPIGMRRPIATTRTTPVTTIRRNTILTMGMTTIRGQATRLCRGWMRPPCISMSTLAWATDCSSTPEGVPSKPCLGGIFLSVPIELGCDGRPSSIYCDYWNVLQDAIVPS